jgi:signal transduction histidine kinase
MSSNLYLLGETSNKVKDIVERRSVIEKNIQKSYEVILSIHSDIWDTMLFHPNERANSIRSLENQATDFYQNMNELIEKYPEEQENFTRLSQVFRSYIVFGSAILDLSSIDEFKSRTDMVQKFRENKFSLTRILDAFATSFKNDFDNSLYDLNRKINLIWLIMLTSTVSFLLIAFLVSYQFATFLTKPIEKLTSYALKVADGNYQIRITDTMKGEMESLAKAFNRMLSELNRVILDLRQEVTVRIAAENKLKELNDTLEQKVSEKIEEIQQKEAMMVQQARFAAMGEMLSSIAHHWRQPLNILSLIIQLFEVHYKYSKLDENYIHESVQMGTKIAEELSDTINTFRSFLVIDPGRSRFSARDCIRDALRLMESMFIEGNIDYHFEDLTDRETYLYGQPKELIQVFLHLSNNSCDAFRNRNIQNPEVRIQLLAENRNSMIRFHDNAGGIPDSIIEKIFEPYFSTKAELQGTGLGLYIVKNILEKNFNGSISVRNSEKGAEFTLKIPEVI